jgi:hypothetical protein
MYRIGANNIGIAISAAKVLDISSTGLSVTGALSASGGYNGTVGATTANSGAFTTLSATGAISTSAGNITALNGILQVGSGSKQLYLRTLTGVNRIDSYDNPITATQPLTINSSIMRMAIADTDRAVLDSNGLAVTGQFNTTYSGAALGSMTGAANAYYDWSDGTTITRLQMSGGSLNFGTAAAGGTFNLRVNSSTIASVTSTGLGVGTSSPAVKLHVQSDSAGATALRLTDAVRGTINIDFPATSQIRFDVGAAEKTLFSSGGNAYLTINDANSGGGVAVTGALSASGSINYGAATDGAFSAIFAGNALNGIQLRDSTDTSGAVFAAFRNSSATTIGSISRVTTTNAVVYNTTSDGRLKENLRDFTDSGRLIDSLKPRVFDWKNSDENGKNVVGFIAQEEHAADPIFAHIGAVSVGDEDPETITKQWQRSDSALIPILVAELKALRQRVAALESN